MNAPCPHALDLYAEGPPAPAASGSSPAPRRWATGPSRRRSDLRAHAEARTASSTPTLWRRVGVRMAVVAGAAVISACSRGAMPAAQAGLSGTVERVREWTCAGLQGDSPCVIVEMTFASTAAVDLQVLEYTLRWDDGQKTLRPDDPFVVKAGERRTRTASVAVALHPAGRADRAPRDFLVAGIMVKAASR